MLPLVDTIRVLPEMSISVLHPPVILSSAISDTTTPKITRYVIYFTYAMNETKTFGHVSCFTSSSNSKALLITITEVIFSVFTNYTCTLPILPSPYQMFM